MAFYNTFKKDRKNFKLRMLKVKSLTKILDIIIEKDDLEEIMGNKKCIYSIRKLSLGVASVVVACGLGFLSGSVGSVSADETLAASHTLETEKNF